jgi:hypothetical protein
LATQIAHHISHHPLRISPQMFDFPRLQMEKIMPNRTTKVGIQELIYQQPFTLNHE